MEINALPLEGPLSLRDQQTPIARDAAANVDAFEKVLNQQLARDDARLASVSGAESMQTALLSQVKLEKSGAIAGDANQEALMAAFDQASGALDLWDQYARVLGCGSSDASLRDAWSLLEGLDSNIAALRANPIANGNEALSGIINELEVMAATEKFKFNRGDYLG